MASRWMLGSASVPESQTQILVLGLCSWLLPSLTSSVDGWGGVLSLLPLPPSVRLPEQGGPGHWSPASSSVPAPGSLPDRDPEWDDGSVSSRRQKVSQDQSAPYSRDLGSVWDTEIVHMSCCFSGQRQNRKRNVTQSRSEPRQGPARPQPCDVDRGELNPGMRRRAPESRRPGWEDKGAAGEGEGKGERGSSG